MKKCRILKYILIFLCIIIITSVLVLIIPLLNEIAFEGSDDIEPYTEEELFDMGIEEGMWITKRNKENSFIVRIKEIYNRRNIIVDKDGNPINELNEK